MLGGRVEKRKTEEQEHRRQRVLPIDSDSLKMLKKYIESRSPVIRDGRRLIFGIIRHRAWQIARGCAEKAGLPKLHRQDMSAISN